MANCIVYNSGYKYQIKRDYTLVVDVFPPTDIDIEFIQFATDGTLCIRGGYAWDGPSGPTIGTLNFMRGSLVHDALYQLMRERHLDHMTYREQADRLLQRICIEDGMSRIRAWIVYQAVRRFGDPNADPASSRPPVHAPEGCID